MEHQTLWRPSKPTHYIVNCRIFSHFYSCQINKSDICKGSAIVFFNKFFICHFLQVCVVWRFIVTCDGNVKPVIFSGLPWLVGCKKIIKIEGLRTRLKLLRRSSFNQSDSNSSSTSVVKPATVSPGKVSLGMIFPKFDPKPMIDENVNLTLPGQMEYGWNVYV